MRYLLDTNILSNVIKPEPSESLVAWMAEQADQAGDVAARVLQRVLPQPKDRNANEKSRQQRDHAGDADDPSKAVTLQAACLFAREPAWPPTDTGSQAFPKC